MTDAPEPSPDTPADNACLNALEQKIEAVPPRETATIDVPDDCPVTTDDILQLGHPVRAYTFAQKDGVMAPSRLLVEGDEKADDKG